MKRKGFALLALVLYLIAFCFGCKEDKTDASSAAAQKESLVIGSASEWGNEYPDFNESFSFSDVSAPLVSDVASSENSQQSLSSDKSSSKNSSQALTSSLSSSKPSSNQTTTVVTSTASSTTSSNSAVSNYNTVKAVWISYIDFSSILTNKSESAFRKNFEAVCKNAKNFGLNTLICQVRAFGDAAYPSEYFAWSQFVAGVGKNPGYDPLKIMIELAHKYNLSFHAWINPFRTFLNTQVSSVPSNTVFKKWYNDSSKRGKHIVNFSDRWYYNPGEPEVRELIVNGIVEIIKNYNVDGIHFDDYFYPRGIDKTFDSSTYSKYGGGKTLENFRRASVSTLVKEVYNTVKKHNSKIVFGISPDANVDNNQNQLYSDVKLWGKTNGYVDYLCPQIYYNYKSESTSFSKALSNWNSLVTASNVKLMVGLAPYKIGYKEDSWACLNANRENHKNTPDICGAYGWQVSDASKSNILARQCEDSLSLKKCGGVFLYSYQYVFNVSGYFSNTSTYVSNAVSQAKTEMENLKETLK
ncbi:MAG: hypothetical protein E7539_00635 [Ruminococcaceae bacterium]|nr:hypothetical protein [Oscillospiraceae bacterium]